MTYAEKSPEECVEQAEKALNSANGNTTAEWTLAKAQEARAWLELARWKRGAGQ